MLTISKSTRNRNKNSKANSANPKVNIKRRPRNGKAKPKGVTDARQKIIQKKRKTVRDARDILAKLAKKQDARTKLAKLRELKTGAKGGSNIQVIGTSILRKTDRNGKISLVTSKAKQATTDINLAIKQQLGLVPASRSPKKSPVRRPASGKSAHYAPTMIRKTIFNDDYPTGRRYGSYRYGEASDLYRWVRPGLRPSEMLMRRGRDDIIEELDWARYSSASNR